MVKRPSSNSIPQSSPKRQKTANDQLESVKTFFRELIAQRHRDSALARREELWTEVVDKFAQLVRLLSMSCGDEEEEIIDFQLVGSALELSTEFYAAELDSLSNDVYKLTATLQRTEKKSSRSKSVETPSIAQHVMSIKPTKASPQPRRHIIKRIRTIVTPDLLNQKLLINPLSSPIFLKLNSSVGDMCKAHLMLRNILPPSQLTLHVDKAFWSSRDEMRTLCPLTKVVALPPNMFTNFNSLRIRREIDYNMTTTTLLNNRRVAVTLDEEDLRNAADYEDEDDSLIGADSIISNDVVADNHDEVELTELDVDENLNSILRFNDEHGENEIADQHESDSDVDEDEEAKINPNYLLSAHENLQLLSSSRIDLVTKKTNWRATKQTRKQIRITLRDILARIERCSGGIDNADDVELNSLSQVPEVVIHPAKWSQKSLMLKPRLPVSCRTLFDTFLYSSCEVDDAVIGKEQLIDSGIVADVGTTQVENEVNFEQQSENHSDTADAQNEDSLLNWQPSNFLVTSTPLQTKIATRKSMKAIENETLRHVSRVDGKPVRFSRLYADVSRSLEGETSCALTFFSVLRAASRGGEGDTGKVEISRDDDTEIDDFWIRSLRDDSGRSKTKRKALFNSQDESDAKISYKRQKLCEAV